MNHWKLVEIVGMGTASGGLLGTAFTHDDVGLIFAGIGLIIVMVGRYFK